MFCECLSLDFYKMTLSNMLSFTCTLISLVLKGVLWRQRIDSLKVDLDDRYIL